MPSSEQDKEAKTASEVIIDSLRDRLAPLMTRLTPEIEPAPVYSPHVRVTEEAE